MRYASLLVLIVFCAFTAEAKHITGGEMIYEYLGPGSAFNSKSFRITLRLFRDEDCVGCADMPNSVAIGIFDNATRVRFGGYHNVPISNTEILPLYPLPPCITNAPSLNYRAGYYSFEVELPDNAMGYTVTYQTCCRIDGIMNVPNSVGATYIAQIPGSGTIGGGIDNSPQFARGISVVCYNKPFTLDFSAIDPDPTDSLIYSLCGAFDGGGANNANFNTPSPPFYNNVDYIGGYSGSYPLGLQATIDRNTGIISGIAPDAGRYVVSVCIAVVRNDVVITEHRKDFIITVAPCDFAGAQLQPSYVTCDGFSYEFENLNTSPLNNTFLWTFGDGQTSTEPNPTHTYAAAGVYNVKLVVNQGAPCSDSTTSVISVFPGYFPGFTSNAPMCKGLPVSFSDVTTANYGAANTWLWNFGDENDDNTSTVKNPVHTFSTPGSYIVTLDVSSDKGCKGIFKDTILIVDKPAFTLTRDTLICSIDTLQLRAVASSPGSIVWTPNYNISNVNSFTPLVAPDVTTIYTATFLDNFGCGASQQVRVNVVDSVTLSAMNDTTICTTDPVTLRLNSNALRYNWQPAVTLNDPNVKDPVALPTGTTVYTVKASIGKCESTEQIAVRTVAYPQVTVSPDTSVCFGNNAMLRASGGSKYTWSPTVFLNASNIPNPLVVKPTTSLTYLVSVRDTLGCPKPVTKTIRLSVVKIIADAGPSDTSVVLGQPLQLTATGSAFYAWNPVTWLSNSFVPNPVAFPQDNILYTVRVSDSAGCFATDTINVKLFKIEPDILVPSGFTPDGDGLNDLFRPIPIGMRAISAFRVYNRWGQLLFSTTRQGHGWDGKFGGNAQDTGTYVWYAEGIDYLNKKIHRKGYVVLIR